MPDEMRATLESMNRTELVQVARAAGLGNVPREQSVHDLVEAILQDECDGPDALEKRRVAIEAHIKKFRKRLLSQLPGCNGCCTTYGCPDLVVARCWEWARHDML